ncbi:DUF11 domain-containing protein [Candidatus Parcubacteria bacterium]|nr:DUF11 domain-containing protein [Candidatus Parcubacteria bacterium]
MNKPLLFLFVILLITASALGLWYFKGNEWGKKEVKLEILNIEQAQAGEEVVYTVKFKNNGKAALEEVELAFEFPENSLPLTKSDATTTEGLNEVAFNRAVKFLETLYSGEERSVEFRATVFGKESDILEAKAFLTYRPQNLKAKFESKTTSSLRISTVPMTFEFDLPLKVENGETLDFSLNYFSNIDYVLENLRVKTIYPAGFIFTYAKPAALDQTEWVLPSLYQVDGGRINIQGSVEGREGEKKIFRAQLGAFINEKFIVLKEIGQAVEIQEPSFYVSALVNGSPDFKASVGDVLHYEVFFKNIGKTPIQNKFLLVKLDGDFYDLTSVRAEQGDVGKGDNSIIWDWKNVSALRFLDAGDEGKVDFWVKVKSAGTTGAIKNPTLKAVVSIGGIEKTISNQISSTVDLAQKIYYNDEVFGNTGPIPPQVGQETTYTVLWQIKNSWNSLANVKVKAVLPSYVKPTGDIFPEGSKLTYDSVSRELVWSVGTLQPFQGYGNKTPLTIAFKISLIPTTNQKGSKATLINQASFSGEDIFTLEEIVAQANPVLTDLPDDNTVSEEQGIVQ